MLNESAVSVILISRENCDDIREVLGFLEHQTIIDRLELVVVVPSADRISRDDPALRAFSKVRVLGIGLFSSVAKARAEGVLASSAPVIALTEEHSFPEPEWAGALLAAHQSDWAVVGPVVDNANPDSWLSWTNLLIEYAPWIGVKDAQVVDHLPGHNSAYKRDVLLKYVDELEQKLAAETPFHWELKTAGYDLYLEPKARTRHLNFANWSSTVTLRFHSSRQFAGQRGRRWSTLRRLAYVLGAPLIPCVRLWRIVRHLRQTGDSNRLLPGVLPYLVAGLVISAAGEMVGYLSGPGESRQKQYELEFDRRRHLQKH